MRYLLDILVQKKGDKIKSRPIYENAYWRLAPKPMNSNAKLVNKMRANLAQHAIPVECSAKDIETARKAVRKSIALITADPALFLTR